MSVAVEEDPAVTRFRRYLRIKTVSGGEDPKPDYGKPITSWSWTHVATSLPQRAWGLTRQFLETDFCVVVNRVGGAVKFLQGLGEEIGLVFECIEFAPDRPVVILTWPGTRQDLPSVMLNSHIDVVPVYPVSIYIDSCLFLLRLHVFIVL